MIGSGSTVRSRSRCWLALAVIAGGVLVAAIVAVRPAFSGATEAGTAVAAVRAVPCGPPGLATLARSASVRVYVDADNLIGCDAGQPPLVLEYDISPYRPLPVAIAGSLVAYAAVTTSDGSDYYDTGVTVQDLAASADADELVASGDEETHEKVVRIVLSPTGSVAWTSCPISRLSQEAIVGFCERPDSVVHVYQVKPPRDVDATHRQLVAEGSDIDANSLRATSSTTYEWTQAGRQLVGSFARRYLLPELKCATAGLTILRGNRIRVFRAPTGGPDTSRLGAIYACLLPAGRPVTFTSVYDSVSRPFAIGGTYFAYVLQNPGDSQVDDASTDVVILNLRNHSSYGPTDLGRGFNVPVQGLTVDSSGCGAFALADGPTYLVGHTGKIHPVPDAVDVRRLDRHGRSVTIVTPHTTLRVRLPC